MNVAMKPLLLSLKPCYANLIFRGHKETELRRRINQFIRDWDVFIYVSSPVRQLRGGFRVGRVWHGPPEDVWKRVSRSVGVDKKDFDAYYAGRNIAYALKITGVWEYKNPADLDTLKKRLPNFVVPQSWRYTTPEECRSFRKMKVVDPDCKRNSLIGKGGQLV